MSVLGESTSILVGIIEINPEEIQEIQRTKSGWPLHDPRIVYTRSDPVVGFVRSRFADKAR